MKSNQSKQGNKTINQSEFKHVQPVAREQRDQELDFLHIFDRHSCKFH